MQYRYLNLERSSAIPVLARADGNAFAWQYKPRDSSFSDYFNVADSNEATLFSKSSASGKATVSAAAATTTARLQRYGRV